ncbi:DNA cytosine methyltransferase [Paracidovorax citrulli]|uniref:DNA cytosine methyltransferase n=2 Tax=Paracidovorax citrulli TaxID=80869 RepID=A0ABY9AWL3_PARCI|nr:DNA cytosine methyltransferase [Paracidovorax citrulli]UEG48266.1 DNA cytosine methyltransferase [Paracidovorax citrulli]WIY31339.1 DNA cytosine methyltransferase [Paracidovorax citrulli]WIY36850.1 DNA cytosine methyltransferase [Paracidovorax citrulli]WIY40617.1 DNA cytosine methyltransferase [Paracidovorax citrulli]WIY42149.1 DNA cytosine methyltransferase [Paracidovorax citrulli]
MARSRVRSPLAEASPDRAIPWCAAHEDHFVCEPSGDGSLGLRWRMRRLMPRECQRLQGMPDDHTLVPNGGRPAADGPRYEAIGNSMAVRCVAWIGARLQRALSGAP